ncbi:MAG: MATE family efflux transporter [Candidatus Omnitrophota bacterium]
MKDNKARLIHGSVGKTLIRMTIPMTFGLLGIVAFNLVDLFFVGKLGTKELAALSFTFPVVMIIGSFALGIGVGTSAVISRAIGTGNHNRVKTLAAHSLILSTLLGFVFVAVGVLTIDPVFRLLGATSSMLPLIRQYMLIWYSGVIFIIIPMVGNSAIRATGEMKIPSILMLIAVGINIILDPLLIYGIGPFPELGLKGAAIATVISRFIALISALYFLIYRYDMISFVSSSRKRILVSWRAILYLGIPTAGTRIIVPLAMGIITRLIASYGPEAVAGFGVSTRIEFFALSVVFALATVIGPFVGQNWGAKQKSRIMRGIGFSKRFSIGWGIFMLVFLAVFARPVAAIFNNSPVVISTVVLYLRIVPVGYGLFGVLIIAASTLTVLRKPVLATGLMLLQMVVLYVPLAFLGSRFFGLAGIFAALVTAYLIAGVLSNFVLAGALREI